MKVWIAIAALAVSGCATRQSQQAAEVLTADERMVDGCQLLGEVDGSSGWGGVAASKGMNNARNEAREKAARLGATHVVWMNMAGGYTPYAVGRAYRCAGNQTSSAP